MNPWTRDDEPAAPRRPGRGCLVAAIVAAVGLVLVLLFATRILGAALDGVHVR